MQAIIPTNYRVKVEERVNGEKIFTPQIFAFKETRYPLAAIGVFWFEKRIYGWQGFAFKSSEELIISEGSGCSYPEKDKAIKLIEEFKKQRQAASEKRRLERENEYRKSIKPESITYINIP